ncbi:alpha/beta hydrolase family protein [Konateibacter massiliensis]|uniref:alpha/beta hydrolase family protein n=1 Tax=Konateibacter massiliensis TaxID=2002841 RepID=UPI000C157052|nr:dienelactone hydrolase family protein [Konateibacter massiliensis]
MGIMIAIMLGIVELGFMAVRIWKKKSFQKEKSVVNLSEFLIVSVLAAVKVLDFSFRWQALLLVLAIRSIWAVICLVRRAQEKQYRTVKTIAVTVFQLFFIGAATVPAIIFPTYSGFSPTGSYEIETAVFTWEDESRVETFETDGSNRNVTVQFWYPKTEGEETFPLIIFSHGAFGYRQSNYSTYAELVSHGYVICSIDHTYHAFFTKQTDGQVITVNPEFIQSVFRINEDGISEDEIFAITREWMELRSNDMNFVLDTIKKKTENSAEDAFTKIDLSKIGIMGHSLGGATAVTVGRQRNDIDAVIDLDGTMLGEELSCENNVYTINEEPYPIPLLCIDTTDHYEEGLTYGDQYVNSVVLNNGIDAREIHFNQAGHLNFTDLPIFSPFLASLLGTGEIDSSDCIQTMNRVILNYYNHYLKQNEELTIQEVY